MLLASFVLFTIILIYYFGLLLDYITNTTTFGVRIIIIIFMYFLNTNTFVEILFETLINIIYLLLTDAHPLFFSTRF